MRRNTIVGWLKRTGKVKCGASNVMLARSKDSHKQRKLTLRDKLWSAKKNARCKKIAKKINIEQNVKPKKRKAGKSENFFK